MNSRMTTLSITLITKDAERTLDACLKAAASIADEIIIIDSGSTDNTLTIAQSYTKHVYPMDWPGFGIQKQRAIEKASCEWVLSIDADEILTPELCQSIKTTIHHAEHAGYELERLWVIGEKIIRHCDTNPWIVRLFKKEQGNCSVDTVHEKMVVSGSIGRLQGPLLHYSTVDMHHWLSKINLYSTLSANNNYQKQKKSSLTKACFAAFLAFIKFYFLKRGFLDGRIGFVVAVNWAAGSYYKHIKLALHDDFQSHSLNAD